ncbi:MAG: flagellar motor switch protein FliG [Bdellovibrionaceae bacterium]|nr:flagellar motor switch protein FliG [Pseudobdellovibrionaceae bacterium]
MGDKSFNDLTALEKSAILLHTLGPKAMKIIFKGLPDKEIRQILNQMGKINKVPVGIVNQVLNEYYTNISEIENYLFSNDILSRDNLKDVLGEDRARNVLSGLSLSGDNGPNLESLEMVDAKTLAHYLYNEHPQTITLIVAHLGKDKRATVLQFLPKALQGEVIQRLSKLESVDPAIIKNLDETLKTQFANIAENPSNKLGGVQSLIDMFTGMDQEQANRMIEELEQRDPILADKIKKEMFTYEDLLRIPDRYFQTLLSKVDVKVLVLSLKTASEAIKNKVFSNMSKRAVENLKDELSGAKPVPRKDVEEAKQQIVALALKLEADKEIQINRGGEDDLV